MPENATGSFTTVGKNDRSPLQMTLLPWQLAANRESVLATPHGAATADFDRCRIQPAFYLKPAGKFVGV